MRSGFVVVVVAGSLVAGSFSARAATAVPLAPGALFSRDVNNDGRDDVVLLDPTDAPAAASVVFGRADRSGPLNRVAQGPGGFAISADGEHLGRVAIVGDVNADGYADIAVGIAERGSQRPGAWLVFGGPDAVPIDLSVPPSGRAVRLPDARSPEFGGAGVVGVGDVNGDGISDIATGQELRGHGGAVVVRPRFMLKFEI